MRPVRMDDTSVTAWRSQEPLREFADKVRMIAVAIHQARRSTVPPPGMVHLMRP
jgi:hypothetical protein